MAISRPISMSVTIKAKPAQVFDALTDSEMISKWSGQKGTVESKIGGKFEMFDGWVQGKVLAFQTGKTLSYTWHTADWDEKTMPSIVKYTFSKTKTGTKLSLKHSGLPDEKSRKEHHGGWTEHVFNPLKQFFGSK